MDVEYVASVSVRAGYKLKRLREARQMTQRDVERETAMRWGYEHRTRSQDVSRIEKGQVEKPPIIDLIHIGEVLGMTAVEILELYELYTPSDVVERRRQEIEERSRTALHPTLREAINLVERLPPDLAEDLLGLIELANAGAVAKARRRPREHGREANPPTK